MCIQNLVKFCPFVVKILSRNKILTSIKGRNSVTNVRKITVNNPNLDLVNMNVYTKFGQNLSFLFKILSGKEILTSIKGRNSVTNVRKIMVYNPNLDFINVNV